MKNEIFLDILLCPIDSFANKSDVVTFIKVSESFAVRSFSSFPSSGFGVAGFGVTGRTMFSLRPLSMN